MRRTRLKTPLRSQPLAATFFVALIIAAGAAVLALWGPRQVANPALFATLLAASALASSLRLRVPLGPSSSNLSVSYSVDFAALLLIGTELTMLVAGVSAWLQSAFGHDRRNPVFRTRLQCRSARADGQSGRPHVRVHGRATWLSRPEDSRESRSRW